MKRWRSRKPRSPWCRRRAMPPKALPPSTSAARPAGPEPMMRADASVRIGGASGGWGDSALAVAQLLEANPDFLIMDYLAEVTMSLLARARGANPALGYVPDFISYLAPV